MKLVVFAPVVVPLWLLGHVHATHSLSLKGDANAASHSSDFGPSLMPPPLWVPPLLFLPLHSSSLASAYQIRRRYRSISSTLFGAVACRNNHLSPVRALLGKRTTLTDTLCFGPTYTAA